MGVSALELLTWAGTAIVRSEQNMIAEDCLERMIHLRDVGCALPEYRCFLEPIDVTGFSYSAPSQ